MARIVLSHERFVKINARLAMTSVVNVSARASGSPLRLAWAKMAKQERVAFGKHPPHRSVV